MSDLWTAVLVLFSVIGITAVLYILMERASCPKEALPLFLLYTPDSAETLLSLCDCVGRLQRKGLNARLCVLDEALNEETRRIAALLEQDGEGIELWNAEALSAYVTGNYGGSNPFGHL